ncbi:MAG TPA: cytochrome c family protein [Candidatus Sulfotelmatobacter sp.]|nr:cytochrome c family protein [Candidatus Sulfotelmatobacter sp.]
MPPLRRLALCALAATFALAPAAGRAQDEGETIFKRNCFVCHTVEPGKNKIGPSLAGVVGRPAGTAPGFSYSEANKNSHVTWTESTLDTYLTDPRKFIPGTKMVFAGLKKPEERQALIAYLKAHP